MFTITLPKAWPGVPSPWNFSALHEIEDCPRRWALSSAAFPELWDGHGYPPALNARALAGQIIHAVVGMVSLALADAGCPHVGDAAAVDVLRKMGGFTLLLREEIDRTIDRHRTNPRAKPIIDQLRDDLLKEMPAMRQQIQQHLWRVNLIVRRAPALSGKGPLGEGSYNELRLRAETLDFVGVVDLLQIAHGRCTIWEFKTGLPDDRHAEQARTYALLWMEDNRRNPNHLPIQQLVLSYGRDVRELAPPDASGFVTIRSQLQERVVRAAGSIRSDPPIARPSPDHCRFCDVRHLCADYWATLPTWRDDGTQSWIDLELRVGSVRGPRSWDADLLVAVGNPKRTPVVVTMANASPGRSLTEGTHVRLLNVRQNVVDDVALIAISAFSEIFIIR